MTICIVVPVHLGHTVDVQGAIIGYYGTDYAIHNYYDSCVTLDFVTRRCDPSSVTQDTIA